jgi:hypothetical protein
MNPVFFTSEIVAVINANNPSMWDFLSDANTYQGIAYTAQLIVTLAIWVGINFI